MIQMHPSRYPTDASRVGLVGTLLNGSALAWFAPLLEKESPLLNNFVLGNRSLLMEVRENRKTEDPVPKTRYRSDPTDWKGTDI